MTDYCFKIQGLTDFSMRRLTDTTKVFAGYGVRMTFLRKVAYIHMNDRQRYCALFNILWYYYSIGQLKCSEKTLEWAKKWHPIWH